MKKVLPTLIPFILIMYILSAFVSYQLPDILTFGSVTNRGDRISGVLIRIYQDGEQVDQVVTSRRGGYGFRLAFNQSYSIELSKKGYLTSMITIDTHAPEEVTGYTDQFLWEPDLRIYRKIEELTLDKFPAAVARYKFDRQLWRFVPDPEYSRQFQGTLDTIKAEIARLEEQKYQYLVGLGDSLYQAGNFEEAMLAYQDAGRFTDDEAITRKKEKAAYKELKKQISANEKYEIAINAGDQELEGGNLDRAGRFYQLALLYKPKEVYPLDQLYVIDSIRSYQWIREKVAYEQFVDRANSHFGASDYDSAIIASRQALSLFPNDEEAKKLLASSEEAKRLREETLSADENYLKKPEDVPALQEDVPVTQEESEPNPTRNSISGNQQTPEPDRELASVDQSTTNLPKVKSDEMNGQVMEDFEEITNGMPADEDSIGKLHDHIRISIKAGDRVRSAKLFSTLGEAYHEKDQLRPALLSYMESAQLSRELGDKHEESEQLENIAIVLYDSGRYDQSLDTLERSYKIAESIDDLQKMAEILEDIGIIRENNLDYQGATSTYLRALKIREQMGDKSGMGETRRQLGNLYYHQNELNKAINEFEEALTIETEAQNNDEISATLNNLGAVYHQAENLERASEYYNEALSISRASDNRRDEAISLNNLGIINFDFGSYNTAIDYYEQSLSIKSEINLKEGMITTLHNLGKTYFAMKEYNRAMEYFTNSLELAEEVNYLPMIWNNYHAFARTYAAMGRYREAYEYQSKYTESKYDYGDWDTQMIELRQQYEASRLAVKGLKRQLSRQQRLAKMQAERSRREKQIMQLEMENNRQQLQRQRIIILASGTGTFLILMFSLIITRQYRQKRKALKIVAQQKQHITDGIAYATRIQRAVLPPEKQMNQILPSQFVLNKPREQVGGDFYWIASHFGKTIVAVSDCTGHGVPGGFMSMLGIAILNEITSSEYSLEPHDILTHLRERVIDALHQRQGLSESMDGMDISLLIFDENSREISFSGAYHSIYLVRGNELEKIKGDRVSIGYQRMSKPFTTKKITCKTSDMIYLSTDGFTDQIGGKENSRFMFGRFKNLLIDIAEKPLEEQKRILNETIDKWKGSHDQTDDILVMGIRMP